MHDRNTPPRLMSMIRRQSSSVQETMSSMAIPMRGRAENPMPALL